MPANIIKLANYERLKSEPSLVLSVETITPTTAAAWLRANRLNRPVRASHVTFLAREMAEEKWMMNGQAIIISENEDVLDGQHRLLAIIESGATIRSLVIYGVKREAFKTIDTGIVRTAADAIAVFFPGRGVGMSKTVAAAIPWCIGLERGVIIEANKIANADALVYVGDHPSLWQCAAEVSGYPADMRVLSQSMATAAYEIFQRRDPDKARDFIQALCTGEMLGHKEPEYILRAILAKDATSVQKYPSRVRMRMVIKAWNLRRRGTTETTRQAVQVHAQDPVEITVL
jgi:hypothetical protein